MTSADSIEVVGEYIDNRRGRPRALQRLAFYLILALATGLVIKAGGAKCYENYTDKDGVERRREISCDGSAEPKPAPRKGEKHDPKVKK